MKAALPRSDIMARRLAWACAARVPGERDLAPRRFVDVHPARRLVVSSPDAPVWMRP